MISDPLGLLEVAGDGAVKAGIIIGQSHLPVVNRGRCGVSHREGANSRRMQAAWPELDAPLYDEDEII